MTNINIDPVYLLSMGVFFIVWLVRLEALALKTKERQDDHKENNTVMWSKIEALQTSLTQMSLSLGRIEGKLENKNNN